MAEEFQESDVIFSDHRRYPVHENNNRFDFHDVILAPQRHNSWAIHNKKKKINKMANSLPVKIPESIFQYAAEDELEEEWEDGEMVPPHVIVGRRVEGKIAFSVCTGNGRTLKGRDLSRVRNSILRMTGFLET